MAAHDAIKTASELGRTGKVLGSSLQCSVVLEVPDDKAASLLTAFGDELAAMFVVSAVEVVVADGSVSASSLVEGAAWTYSEGFEVAGVRCTAWVLPPRDHKCARCWRYISQEEDALCGRCEDVVAAQQ